MAFGLREFGDLRVEQVGVDVHAALLERPCSCIRRIADGVRAQEVRFWRFLRNVAVTVAEMVNHAVAGTAERVAGRDIVAVQDTIRFAPVTLCRPKQGARNLPRTVKLMLVEVREVAAPEGTEPIHWRLLTTHKVTTRAEARRIVDLYRMRWTIEEFFRLLKSAGFDIENADISDPEVMAKLVAATTIAGVTTMQRVKARDGTTDQQMKDAFEPEDQPLLEALSAQLEGKTERQKNLHPKGSLAFAGTGYYGKPGPKVIARGPRDYQLIKYGNTLRL